MKSIAPTRFGHRHLSAVKNRAILPLVAAVASILSAGSLQAVVSFNMTFATGQISGLTNATSTAILVVDTLGNGFSGISTPTDDIAAFNTSVSAAGTFNSINSDDYVLYRMVASDLGPPGVNLGFQFDAINFLNAPLNAGAKMGLYWFPGGSNLLNSTYGFFRSDVVSADSTIGYVVPANGAVDSLITVTSNIGSGDVFNGTPVSTGTIGAIPEPSRAILALMGMGLAFLRRRRS